MAVEGITARDMVTEKSFENAVMVHAAISGSTNTLLHLPAIAREFGVELDADSFDRMHRGAHYLLDIRPRRALARGVLLLRRGRAPDYGGNQVHAAPGRDDRHRQDPGRETWRS